MFKYNNNSSSRKKSQAFRHLTVAYFCEAIPKYWIMVQFISATLCGVRIKKD